MLLKHPTIEIPPDNPFRDDQLERQQYAFILTEVLRSVTDPFVLAIDAGWGMGKTTFIKMWMEALKAEGFHCLYFNAWESDFADDPIVPFVGEIQIAVQALKLEAGIQTKADAYLNRAKELAGKIAKRLIPAAAKVATAGILDLEKLTEGAIAGTVEKLVKEQIDSYDQDQATLKEFRENLEQLAQLLTEKQGENRPLVFFIDELDRCRPTYAIELLERLKHLFSVAGIVFVLALDESQILHSIRSRYGTGFDARGYLKRFIDLEYRLPEPSGQAFTNYLFQSFGFEDFFQGRGRGGKYEIQQLVEVFSAIAESLGMSLRDQEQSFSRFSLVLRMTPAGEPLAPILLALLVALKSKRPDLYSPTLGLTPASAPQIKEVLASNVAGRTLSSSNYGIALHAYLKAASVAPAEIEDHTHQYLRQAKADNRSPEQRRTAQIYLDIFREISANGHPALDLVKKIEITEHFA
jgi:hypothetical protein